MCEAPGIGLPPAAGDPARPSPHAVFYLRQCRQENVEVMLANIDKTEVLENKSAALADQAKTFHKTARATRKHMCRQNAKMNLIICCVCGARSPATLLPVCPHRSQQFLNRGCSHLLRVLLAGLCACSSALDGHSSAHSDALHSYVWQPRFALALAALALATPVSFPLTSTTAILISISPSCRCVSAPLLGVVEAALVAAASKVL
jgi:hypothetical protein